MSSRYPTDWMWAQACELLEQAERMHRQFFHLTTSSQAQALWEPPADVFEDENEIVIVLALPGVPAERIEVTFEPGVLVVRAERPPSFFGTEHEVRQLEIPYGGFERRIRLPAARFDSQTHQLLDGCLVLRLRKTR
jgi:HSP20 family protein